MPGFLGKIGQLDKCLLFNPNKNEKLINKVLFLDNLYIEQRTVNKFLNDKMFNEDEDFFILTEGIILNSIDLIDKYKQKSDATLISWTHFS